MHETIEKPQFSYKGHAMLQWALWQLWSEATARTVDGLDHQRIAEVLGEFDEAGRAAIPEIAVERKHLLRVSRMIIDEAGVEATERRYFAWRRP